MNIYGAKFQEHCFNISRDIVYSVFTTFLVAVLRHHHWYNLHNRKTLISLKQKKIFQKEKNAIFLYFERPVKLAEKFFCVIYTLIINGIIRQCYSRAICRFRPWADYSGEIWKRVYIKVETTTMLNARRTQNRSPRWDLNPQPSVFFSDALTTVHWVTGDSMVSKGQFVGLDWNRITRLHSQIMIGTPELANNITLPR